MISEVVMPQMGADMVEGTIVRWLKHEGDVVARGEIIAEIETDKANVEIEAFESGLFRATLAAEGDVVPVGGLIAIIAGVDDDISTYVSGDVRMKTVPVASKTAATVTSPPPARQSGGERLRVSPVARRIAEAARVDLASVHGTGPDGRIVRRDVEAAAATAPSRVAPPASPAHSPASTGSQPSKMRQAIARRMAQSKREAPHYYLLVDIDMTDAMAAREQINSTLADGAHVSVNDLIVRACALALQSHPEFNATTAGESVVRSPQENVCIAVALEDGLIAPAIVDAGSMTLVELAAKARDLASRAKGGALRPAELTEGTFTVTNLGAYGVEALIGIIQPPQTAILGVGSVLSSAAVRDGAVVVREMIKVALSADHRFTDGAQGAHFLGEIKRLLEHPILLVL